LKGGIIVSIEKLENIKKNFTIKYNVIRTKEFLVEINEGYGLIRQFMNYTIDILKHQSDQIADLHQALAQKEDVIDYDNVKIGGTD
jgi:hypothetical protein